MSVDTAKAFMSNLSLEARVTTICHFAGSLVDAESLQKDIELRIHLIPVAHKAVDDSVKGICH